MAALNNKQACVYAVDDLLCSILYLAKAGHRAWKLFVCVLGPHESAFGCIWCRPSEACCYSGELYEYTHAFRSRTSHHTAICPLKRAVLKI